MLLSECPGPALKSAVECLWHYAGNHAQAPVRDRVLPNGRFQIVLNLSAGAATVSGLRLDSVVVDEADLPCAMGAVLRPGVATRFFEGSALDFSGRSVSLDAVWGFRARLLLDQLRDERSAWKRLGILEATLTNIWHEGDGRRRPLHPTVMHALRVFHVDPNITRVGHLSREVGWSRRWLTHVFAESVGMTPKRYCRLLRFQHVARQVASGKPIEWVELAIASGFSDQAHLAHEFRAFSGFTPEGFLRAQRPFANHVRLD
jgi:AraC-like DNA-binding protein